MAIALRSINFIVQRKVIDAKFPGGWDAWLTRHAEQVGVSCWYDDHLFRYGTSYGASLFDVIWEWSQKFGFEPKQILDGQEAWGDFCVVEGEFAAFGPKCPWLVVDNPRTAHLAGTDIGNVMDRHNIQHLEAGASPIAIVLHFTVDKGLQATRRNIDTSSTIVSFPEGHHYKSYWADNMSYVMAPLRQNEAVKLAWRLLRHVEEAVAQKARTQDITDNYKPGEGYYYIESVRTLERLGIEVISVHAHMHPQPVTRPIGCDSWGMFRAQGRLYNVYAIVRWSFEMTVPGGYISYKYLHEGIMQQAHPVIYAGLGEIGILLDGVSLYLNANPSDNPPIPENFLDGLEFCNYTRDADAMKAFQGKSRRSPNRPPMDIGELVGLSEKTRR